MGFNNERGDAERCEKRSDERDVWGDRQEVLGDGGVRARGAEGCVEGRVK